VDLVKANLPFAHTTGVPVYGYSVDRRYCNKETIKEIFLYTRELAAGRDKLEARTCRKHAQSVYASSRTPLDFISAIVEKRKLSGRIYYVLRACEAKRKPEACRQKVGPFCASVPGIAVYQLPRMS